MILSGCSRIALFLYAESSVKATRSGGAARKVSPLFMAMIIITDTVMRRNRVSERGMFLSIGIKSSG
jgi:hypothetical protein